MTLTQLKYFYEVYKTRNFTAAASNLYVSQPSLSYAIQSLEKELDVSLFIRQKNKPVELTEYGNILLPYVIKTLHDLEEAKEKIQNVYSPLLGTVCIELFYSVSLTLAPTLIKHFINDNRDTDITFDFVVNHTWTEQEEDLAKGQCDLILSATKANKDCKSSLIGYQRCYAFLHESHPLADSETLSITDLKDDDFVLFSPGSNLDHAIKSAFKTANISPNYKYTSDWCSQFLEISTGKKTGLNVDYSLSVPYIRKIPLSDPDLVLPLYLKWPTNRGISQATEFVRDYFLDLTTKLPKEDLIF